MVTKRELEDVLDQVNAILKAYDERLKKLENTPKTTARATKKNES